MSSNIIPFNKQLRKVTRDVHSISDALVNTKLAFALSNNDVWAEGLLVFYEIFRFLEEAMQRHKGTVVGDMYVEGMSRTSAFEEDLIFYLGEDWRKTYEVRDVVAKYLCHLQEIEKKDPTLLIAYIYHLYMGLLSGGQILRKKHNFTSKFNILRHETTGGNAVTDFSNWNIYDLKKSIVNNINLIADGLDDSTKENVLLESRKVFELNNEIIRSVKGADNIFVRGLFICLTLLICIFLIYIFFFK